MIAHLHTPERLPGESWEAYQARRRWSRYFARQEMKAAHVITAAPLQHRVDAARREERAAIEAIGVRQYRRKRG